MKRNGLGRRDVLRAATLIIATTFWPSRERAHATEANLLPNGDFASVNQIDGWSNLQPPYRFFGSVFWTPEDSDSNLLSGAMAIDSNGAEMASECFATTPGAACRYGGMSKAIDGGDDAVALFACEIFADSVCTQSITTLDHTFMPLTPPYIWQQATPITGTLPSNTLSARCYVAVLGYYGYTRFDDLYFMSPDLPIFQNGFEG